MFSLSLTLLLPLLGLGIYLVHRGQEYNFLVKADDLGAAPFDGVLFSFLTGVMLILAIAYSFRRHKLTIPQLSSPISREEDAQKSLTDFPQDPQTLALINRRDCYREEMKRLKRLKDACPVAAVVVDKHGTIISYNEMYAALIEQYVGQDRELVGMSLRQVTSMAGIPAKDVIFTRVLQGESNIESHQKLSGVEWITRGMPLIDEDTGEIQGAVISVTDITEREKMRRENERLERLRVIGEMAASVAHEIRNPITVVRGNLQLMALKADDKSRYNRMIEELDQANDIIEAFLSLARNRAIPKSLCNINQIVSSLYPILCAETVERGCVLELDLEANLPELLLSEKEIRQLTLNLFRNAADALEDNGRLILRTRSIDGFIELQVQDNGCGIPGDCLHKLTEPFYTTKGNCTGLGLAICHSIAEQHDAELAFDSLEGVGTTVTIRFRLPNRNCLNLAGRPAKVC